VCVPALQAQSVAAFAVPSFASSGVHLPTSSAVNPLYGSVAKAPATQTPIRLSLIDAVNRGLENNLALLMQQQTTRIDRGKGLRAFNALMPNLSAQAQTGTQSIDIAALGIKASVFAPKFHIPPSLFPTIVKVNNTSAQINLSQRLFNLPAIELWRAAKSNTSVSDLNTLNVRGNVVLLVSTAYLQTLAAAADLQNEQALLQADSTALDQAKQSHEAGVATNLDELRARVQYQVQQQALLNAENIFAKDKIALSRMIGLAADQPIELTDTAPDAEYAVMPLDQAKQIAYGRRKDYLSLLAQLRATELARKAVRYQRAPSLSMGGYYGVSGQTHGLYHGVFLAQGTLNIPVFHEAKFRGDGEVVDAKLSGLREQIADLEVTIESQIRSSMLDVQATAQLVKVAQSNVDLAREELRDSSDRFIAGVDDNLPEVQAQAALANAQTQMVNALYQYNQAKLNLARNTGVVETQYQTYLGE
jgi:outer membrane protein TolC